jgi:hypothetical protein
MVKRLNDTSHSPAPLGPDGPASHAEAYGPPNKKARILEEPGGGLDAAKKVRASWEALSLEIKGGPVEELIDKFDIKTTLKNLTAARATSKSFKDAVDHQLDNKNFIQEMSIIMKENTQILEAFDNFYESNNMKYSRLNTMTQEASFIPIRSADERSIVVNYALNYKDENDHAIKDAMCNLIRNIDYTKTKEKIRIVKYVCVDDIEEDIARDLVSELIEKAEHLAPEECSLLAKKSCRTQRYEENDWHGLKSWAPKMDLLDEKDQDDILSYGIYADEHFFDGFAEHIDKVAKINRPRIVAEIVKLPASHPGKFEALSHLAKHLDCIDIPDRPEVISSILNNVGKGSEQSVDEQPWYSTPEFCEIEAVHFLSTHKTLLDPSEQSRVDSLIDTIISETDPAAYGAKSQLITHIPAEERLNFVKTTLGENNADIEEGVVYGLTARIENLDKGELSKYASLVPRLSDENNLASEIVTYNIRNNLEVFDKDQRSALVKRQRKLIRESGVPSDTVAFKYIAENAKHLRDKDVRSTINTARLVVENYIADDNPMEDGANASSIRSCHGYAVRCLANWAMEAAAHALVHQKKAVAREGQLNRTPDVHQDVGAASPRGYDERSRSRETSLGP